MYTYIRQYKYTVFPEDPYEQLYNAIFAVFDSWTSSRAIKFRQVCIYMCVYIYAYICIYICVHTYLYIYVYIHMYIYVYIYICIYMCTCIYMYIYVRINKSLCICIVWCMNTCKCPCVNFNLYPPNPHPLTLSWTNVGWRYRRLIRNRSERIGHVLLYLLTLNP
jgi:hypothetical protein